MNPIVEKLIFLLAGGAAGSLLTSFVMKPKYEEQIERLEDEVEKYESQMDEIAEETRQAVLEGFELDEKDNTAADKYDDDADEENEKLRKISRTIVKKANQAKSKPDPRRIIEDNGYSVSEEAEDDTPDQNEVIDDDAEPPFDDDYDDIEIITGEEVGEYSDYDKEEYYYTRDKVLIDDQGNQIEDVDSIVGYDSLNQFGMYDDDAVYVRNHRLKTDISIFKEPRAYRDLKRE